MPAAAAAAEEVIPEDEDANEDEEVDEVVDEAVAEADKEVDEAVAASDEPPISARPPTVERSAAGAECADAREGTVRVTNKKGS